jgi:copper chaperone CopZ
LTDAHPDPPRKEIRFSVASISCVACTPAFKKGLERVEGVGRVRQFPMLNKIVIDYDPEKVDESKVRQEIYRVAETAGFKGKVIISK